MIPTHLIIHHAASGTVAKNVDISADEIDRIHKGNGWRGIGYHYVVRFNGLIEKGRHDNETGAHCPGYNNRSLGICFSGNMQYHTWTEEQTEKGIILIADLARRYGIPIQNILGHNEAGIKTACPGKLVSMYNLRNLVSDMLNQPTPVQPIPEPHNFDSMFKLICMMFDHPDFKKLPGEAQVALKQLRYTPPFDTLTRD
jgi:hypothetical protein